MKTAFGWHDSVCTCTVLYKCYRQRKPQGSFDKYLWGGMEGVSPSFISLGSYAVAFYDYCGQ